MKEQAKTFREKLAITGDSWQWYARLFAKGMVTAVRLADKPLVGPFLKKVLLFDQPEKNYTQAFTLNINLKVDEKEAHQNVVLPIDLIRRSIETSPFRAIMHKCLCRTGNNCQNFNIDYGCIFIGEAAKSTVENGIAREATVQEALSHMEKAVDTGLVGMSTWIEIEKYVWGIKEEGLRKFLEICFCCPCCCLILKNMKKIPPDIRQRFKGVGWKSTYLGGCNGCGICEESCPAQAITVQDDTPSISDQCLGCGICAFRCSQKALETKPIAAPKENLQAYYEGFRPDV